jgi:dipeptidyl-peptidase-4
VGASFSKLRSYYALTCLGPDPATVKIYNNDHQFVLSWTDNAIVRDLLTERLIPQQRDFNITVNGYDSRVRLFLPPDFNENESYPLLVHV